MKCIFTFLFVLLAAGTANAQYFQSIFGTNSFSEPARKGSVAYDNNGDLIYLHTGSSTDVPTGYQESVFVVCADQTGAVGGGGTFARRYELTYGGNSVSSIGVSVAQLQSSTDIIVMGNFYRPASPEVYGVFYMRLNSSGTIQSLASYTMPNDDDRIGINSMKLVNSDDAIACGYADRDDPNQDFTAMVMIVSSSTGTLTWGKYYGVWGSLDDYYATDLVYSTDTPTSNAELAVVGYGQSGGDENAFFFRLAYSNGAPVTNTALEYDSDAYDRLYSIIDAANTAGGTAGYVTAGYSNGLSGTNDFDAWLLKIRNNGTIELSKQYDYSNGGDNYGRDVVERFNTNSAYEYYVVGWAQDGYEGDADMVVVKTDNTARELYEYTYGGTGADHGYSISAIDGSSQDGLAMFGDYDEDNISDLYIVKSYFNGVNCEYIEESYSETSVSPTPILVDLNDIDDLDDNSLASPSQDDLGYTDLCSEESIDAGDNTRKPAPQLQAVNSDLNAYPQPLSKQDDLNVLLALPSEAAVSFTLSDITGRTVSSKRVTLAAGVSQVKMEIAGLLSSGVYVLRIDDGGSVRSVKVVVE